MSELPQVEPKDSYKEERERIITENLEFALNFIKRNPGIIEEYFSGELSTVLKNPLQDFMKSIATKGQLSEKEIATLAENPDLASSIAKREDLGNYPEIIKKLNTSPTSAILSGLVYNKHIPAQVWEALDLYNQCLGHEHSHIRLALLSRPEICQHLDILNMLARDVSPRVRAQLRALKDLPEETLQILTEREDEIERYNESFKAKYRKTITPLEKNLLVVFKNRMKNENPPSKENPPSSEEITWSDEARLDLVRREINPYLVGETTRSEEETE